MLNFSNKIFVSRSVGTPKDPIGPWYLGTLVPTEGPRVILFLERTSGKHIFIISNSIIFVTKGPDSDKVRPLRTLVLST